MLDLKNNTIHIWEPINNKFLRACLAEFIAMLFFVVMCCGCAMATFHDYDEDDDDKGDANLMQVAASFGFGIMVLAQFVGPLSGGHINCAVSFGLFIAGRCSFIRFVCYTLSGMFGSWLGAMFLWDIFGKNWQGAARAFGSNSWDPEVFSSDQVFFAEFLGTSILMYNVLATIDIPTKGGGPLGVLPIAMSVMVAHLFLLPIDGCSINPTRSFGPALVASMAGIDGNFYNQQWMFWFAPLFGAFVAAIVYEYGSLKLKKRAGAGDMDTALFMGDVARKKKGDDTKNSNAGKKKGLHTQVDTDDEHGDVIEMNHNSAAIAEDD